MAKLSTYAKGSPTALAMAELVGTAAVSEGPTVAWADTPVEYFDIALPAGYRWFRLFIQNLCVSSDQSSNGLGCVLSADDGATWVADAVNHDTYKYGGIGYGFNVGILQDYPNFAAPKAASFQIDIWPGDDVVLPTLQSIWTNCYAPLYLGSGLTFEAFNTAAVVPPVVQRYNKIRLLPVDTGVNPPVSGRTFTHGTWQLLGYPE